MSWEDHYYFYINKLFRTNIYFSFLLNDLGFVFLVHEFVVYVYAFHGHSLNHKEKHKDTWQSVRRLSRVSGSWGRADHKD